MPNPRSTLSSSSFYRPQNALSRWLTRDGGAAGRCRFRHYKSISLRGVLRGPALGSVWRSNECLGFQGFTRSCPISYRGLKLRRVSAALGRCYLRREADLPQVARRRADDQTPGPWYRKGRGIPTTDQMNSGEDLPDGEAELRVRVGGLHTGPGFLCLAGRTPPRRRGDVRWLWFSPRH